MGQRGRLHLRVKLELSPHPALQEAGQSGKSEPPGRGPGGVAFFRLEAQARQRLAPVTPMHALADGLHRTQLEPGHRGDDIEPGLTLDADRLQGEGIIQPADETIRADADADRGSRRSADKSAGERARPDPRRRRKHGPGQADVIGEADLRSKARNVRLVKLRWRAARGRKDTVENT